MKHIPDDESLTLDDNDIYFKSEQTIEAEEGGYKYDLQLEAGSNWEAGQYLDTIVYNDVTDRVEIVCLKGNKQIFQATSRFYTGGFSCGGVRFRSFTWNHMDTLCGPNSRSGSWLCCNKGKPYFWFCRVGAVKQWVVWNRVLDSWVFQQEG